MRWIEPPPPNRAQGRVDLARAALARHPDDPALWRALGGAIAATGRIEALAGHWSDAAARFPDHSFFSLALAEARRRTGDRAGALAALAGAAGASGIERFPLLVRLGCWDEARIIADASDASLPGLLDYLAERPGGAPPDVLLAVAEQLLATRPGDAGALHHRARALALLGRTGEARETIGLDQFLRIGAITIDPAGLRREILANDTLRADPPGKSTHGGRQTEALVRPGDVATPALLGAIRAAVDQYAAQLTGSHGFVRGRPEAAGLRAWAVVYDQAGRQAAHRHPAGWVSGVVHLGGGGPLLLGVPDRDGVNPCGDTVTVAPQPGRLILFPSATLHATAPAEGERIVVAFDVTPAPGIAPPR